MHESSSSTLILSTAKYSSLRCCIYMLKLMNYFWIKPNTIRLFCYADSRYSLLVQESKYHTIIEEIDLKQFSFSLHALMFPFAVTFGTLFAIWIVACETKLNITWWKRRGHLLEMTYAAWNYRKNSSGFYMNSFSQITVCVTKNQINECKRLISSHFALKKIKFGLWLKS